MPPPSFPPPSSALAKSFSACQLLGNMAGWTRQNISPRRRRRRRRRRRARRVRVFCFAGTTSPEKLLVSFLSRPCSARHSRGRVFSFPRKCPGEFKKVVRFLAHKYDTSESTESSAKVHGNAFCSRLFHVPLRPWSTLLEYVLRSRSREIVRERIDVRLSRCTPRMAIDFRGQRPRVRLLVFLETLQRNHGWHTYLIRGTCALHHAGTRNGLKLRSA